MFCEFEEPSFNGFFFAGAEAPLSCAVERGLGAGDEVEAFGVWEYCTESAGGAEESCDVLYELVEVEEYGMSGVYAALVRWLLAVYEVWRV